MRRLFDRPFAARRGWCLRRGGAVPGNVSGLAVPVVRRHLAAVAALAAVTDDEILAAAVADLLAQSASGVHGE